jgi:hypothetical protein
MARVFTSLLCHLFISGSDSGEESEGEDVDEAIEREEDENLKRALSVQRRRELEIQQGRRDGSLAKAELLHIDDMSSDDDETPRNTIGNVPLKWYAPSLPPCIQTLSPALGRYPKPLLQTPVCRVLEQTGP